MLTILQEFPDYIVAVKADGQVTKEDYKDILVPSVDEALKKHDKIRLFYILGKEFSGFDISAMWEDAKVGFGHFTHWERVAVVTDVEWIRLSMNLFSFILPIHIFHMAEEAEARAWITGEEV